MDTTLTQKSELKKPCIKCGAELLYAPGTSQLACVYCGHKQEIISKGEDIHELELQKYLSEMGAQSHSEQITMIDCKSCGANQHIEENYKSLSCVYCGNPLITENAHQEDWILPGAVLPFQIDQNKAHQIFQKWVNNLWFAPNNLKKAAIDPEKTKGLYAPYWTFDAQLFATYTGQRGTYYYVSENYTTNVHGKRVNRTRRVRKTRWSYTSGSISGFIDDTLIKASKQRSGKIPSSIAKWNLKLLKPFSNSYLSGFVTEKYTIPLQQGHLTSKDKANEIAKQWARNDIGGDAQRVSGIDMKLSEETFKHILLPVYISTYHFNNKKYSFFINGESGVLSGERPYSNWKIFFLILGILLFIGIVFLLTNNT